MAISTIDRPVNHQTLTNARLTLEDSRPRDTSNDNTCEVEITDGVIDDELNIMSEM